MITDPPALVDFGSWLIIEPDGGREMITDGMVTIGIVLLSLVVVLGAAILLDLILDKGGDKP